MNFSVLISVYSKERPSFLNVALQSIFEQSLPPNEVVIVKDGPLTKELDLVITNFLVKHHPVIKVVELRENSGLGTALRTGLKSCQNELVARMDSDDIAEFRRFEKQIDFLKRNPSVSVIGAAIEEFKEVPGDLKRFRIPPRSGGRLLAYSRFRNPLNHPAVVFRKSHVIASGSYIHLPLFEDYFLWIRMIKKGFIIENLEEPLLFFRVGNDMIGRRHGISYLIKELRFLNKVKELSHINYIEFFSLVLIKLPLRILPKPILILLYNKILR